LDALFRLKGEAKIAGIKEENGTGIKE